MGLDLALEWARMGHRVLPVSWQGRKRPLIKAWQDSCTTDEDELRRWWAQWTQARVGIATGQPGFDVLDFDVADGKPGLAQLDRLIESGVIEPGTFKVVATPSGGRHLYFRGSEQRNKQNDKTIPGVDFRGVGGMVLAPGNDGYRWVAGRSLAYADLKPIDWAAVARCLGVVDRGPSTETAQVPPVRAMLSALAPQQTPAKSSRLVAPMRYDNAPGEESPLDWYVRNHHFRDVLAADGWTYAYTDQERDYWVRPGKHKRDGVSANVMVNRDGRETLMNYSSTVGWLPTDRGLSVAQYMAYRDHGGDLKAAARAIRTGMMPRRETAPLMAPVNPPVGAPEPGVPQAPDSPGSSSVDTGDGKALVPVSEVGPPTQIREFWRQRPELREVWWKSQIAGVSPWAVLGNVLANVAARVGPHVVLPPLGGVGKAASLNLLVAVSGNSGTGKGLSGSVAREFMGGPYPPQRKPGTGQGIAAMFTEQTKEGPVQSNDTVVLNVNEITQLGAHMSQQGATIMSTLLEIAMGEELGEHYANKELRRPVKEGMYRLALVAGVQPGNSHIILDHAESGLPQRFVWLPAYWGPAVLPDGELRPPAPGSELRRWRAWSAILPGSLDDTIEATGWSPTDAAGGLQSPKKKKEPEAEAVPVKDPLLIEYSPMVRRTIERDRLRRLNAIKRREEAGEDDPGDPDSHLVLTQARIAAHLAIWLDNTTFVSDEMWDMARWVIWVSNDTRLKAQARLRSKAQEKTTQRAMAAVAQRAAVDAHDDERHSAIMIRIYDRIKTIVGVEWTPMKAITNGVAGRDKKILRDANLSLVDAVNDLIRTGDLEYRDAEGAERGGRYRGRAK